MLNEVDVRLAGATRTMKAKFSSIAGIERDLGKSIIRFLDEVKIGDISFTAIAIIVHHGLKGNGDTRLTLEQVGDAIVAEGISDDDPLAPTMAAITLLDIAMKGVSSGKPQEAASQ